jgi:sphingolipid delta-4 desaturase
LPTEQEGRVLRGRWAKAFWLLFQGFAYGLRPLFVHPKKPDRWEIANFVVQLAFNALIFYLWGLRALVYLRVSSLIALGWHPIAGHYISEHYIFRAGQETYSYYGPLNRVTFNVGYHNEHHDFPYVPGSRLARLRQLAPAYYDDLMHHRSWTAALWNYVMRETIGGYSRVKRTEHAR